jgi:hypothetical protein
MPNLILYDDSKWKANIAAFRDRLAGYRQQTAASIEANRKQAEKLKAEQFAYEERRRKENPYLYGRYLPNKTPLPLLASKPIEETQRRLNIEALAKTAGGKRKQYRVFETSPQVSSAA